MERSLLGDWKRTRRGQADLASGRFAFTRPLRFEVLESRFALSTVSVIEALPTLLGEYSPDGPSSLGVSVAINGEWAVAGAEYDNESGERGGAAYVYQKQGNEWVFQTKLVGSDTGHDHNFGVSVAIDDGTIVVGARYHGRHGFRSGAAYVFQYQADAWTEQARLFASDAKPDGYFGRAVAIDGDTIVVGAEPGHFTYHYHNAAAYVFERINGAWGQTAKLTAAPPQTYYQLEPGYGGSVAIDGDTIVVGSSNQFSSNDLSAAYVYERSGQNWVEIVRLVSPDNVNHDGFGAAVAIDGERLLVGAPQFGTGSLSYHGKVSVFDRIDGEWTFAQGLVASDRAGFKHFGSAVAIDGDSIVIGAPGSYHYDNSGSAYLYELDSAGVWIEANRFVALDDQIGSRFGQAVALEGNEILVGEFHHDREYRRIGAVHPFTISATDVEVSLLAMNHVRSDRVSIDYAVQGNVPDLVIRVYRSADPSFDVGDLRHLITTATFDAKRGFGTYSFDPGQVDPSRPYLVAVATTSRDERWVDNNRLSLRQIQSRQAMEVFPFVVNDTLNVEYGRFGTSVAMEGNRAVVGNPISIGPIGATVLAKIDGHWTPAAKLVPSGGEWSFGTSVAISGDTIVVGASRDQTGGVSSGAIYVFVESGGSWIEQAKLTASDAVPYGVFGATVAIEGDTIVVGAPGGHPYNAMPGTAYLFQRMNGVWSQTAKLDDPPATQATSFGASVDISGEHIAVGALHTLEGGAVYLYRREGLDWVLATKLSTPDNPPDLQYAFVSKFGAALDLDADMLLVAPGETDGRKALAYIYRRTDEGWMLETRLTNGDLTLDYAYVPVVAMDGDFVVLGDFRNYEGNAPGAAYLFERLSNGGWIEHPTIIPLTSEPWDHFGQSLALEGEELLIGAPVRRVQPTGGGAVHSFIISSGKADVQLYDMRLETSQQVQVNYAVQGAATHFDLKVYGSADRAFDPGDLPHIVATRSVTASKSTGTIEFAAGPFDVDRPYLIAVAASDVAEWTNSNNHAVLLRQVPYFAVEQFPELLSDPEDFINPELYGYAVAVDGHRAVVGAPHGPGHEFGAGAVYVLERINGRWVQQAKLIAPVGEFGFGARVAIKGNTIVAGAAGPTGLPHDGGSVFVFAGSGPNWTLIQELRASNSRPNYGFGMNVAIDEGTIVVAARANGYNSSDRSEAIYVFEKLGGLWTEVASFDGPDSYPIADYGSALSISGNTIAVGASWKDVVFVYERIGGVWSETAQLHGAHDETKEAFGVAIDVDGNTIVVSGTRVVYVFERENTDWILSQLISTSEPSTLLGFGAAVSLDGNSLAIGVYHDSYGAADYYGAYLFRRSTDGSWLEHAKLGHSGLKSDDFFGQAIAVSGEELFVGAPRRDDPVSDAGTVFAYTIATTRADIDLDSIEQFAVDEVVIRYAASGLTVPAQLSVFRSMDNVFDESDLSHLVASTSIEPGTRTATLSFDPGVRNVSRPYLIAIAVASEPEYSTENNEMVIRQLAPLGISVVQQLPSLVDPAGSSGSEFAAAIDIDRNRAVVGAYLDDEFGANSGAVYVLEKVYGSWVQQAKLRPSGASAYNNFGHSVAISGNRIVIGAYGDDQRAANAGAAYIFAFDGATWVEETKLLGEATNDYFGYSVAIENETVVIGAYGRGYDYYGETLRGAAYVYERQAGSWISIAVIDEVPGALSGNHELGKAVTIHGDTIVIGAPGLQRDYTSGGGGVLILARDDGGWAHKQTIWPFDGVAGDGFGKSLAMNADVLVVGAPEDDSSALDSGSVYVFGLRGDEWQFRQKLAIDSGEAYGQFGLSVALHDNTAVVQAFDGATPNVGSSSVYVYHRRSDGRWVCETRLTDSDLQANNFLYGPVALDGDALLVAGFIGEFNQGRYLINVVDALHKFELQAPTGPALLGDYNSDGTVNAADYVVWRRSFDSSVPVFHAADGNGNGVIEQRDYDIWRMNFGKTLSTIGETAGLLKHSPTFQLASKTSSNEVASTDDPSVCGCDSGLAGPFASPEAIDALNVAAVMPEKTGRQPFRQSSRAAFDKAIATALDTGLDHRDSLAAILVPSANKTQRNETLDPHGSDLLTDEDAQDVWTAAINYLLADLE